MSNQLKQRYIRVLENLELDGIPLSDYDLLDRYSLAVELEKSFDIRMSDEEWEKVFKNGSHESVMDHIKTLI
jgi:acyl carrier protein